MTDPLVPASRWRRLAATLIDLTLVPLLTLLLVMIAGVVEHAEDFRTNIWVLWVFLLAVASYVLLNGYTLWRRGQTLGKLALGIRIAAQTSDAQHRVVKPAFWKLVPLRALFFPLPLLLPVPPLTLLPVADLIWIFGRDRRCLHDRLCGTCVVQMPRGRVANEPDESRDR